MDLTTDFLATEALIIARLKAAVPELKSVKYVSEYKDLEQESQFTPSAQVVYQGYSVVESTKMTHAPAVLEQQYTIWVQAKVINKQSPAAVAGPVLSKVIKALRGYVLDEATAFPIELVNPSRPPLYIDETAIYPVSIKIRFAI